MRTVIAWYKNSLVVTILLNEKKKWITLSGYLFVCETLTHRTNRMHVCPWFLVSNLISSCLIRRLSHMRVWNGRICERSTWCSYGNSVEENQTIEYFQLARSMQNWFVVSPAAHFACKQSHRNGTISDKKLSLSESKTVALFAVSASHTSNTIN